MKSLLPESQVTNRQADKPWTSTELDKLLDLYFYGTDPAQIAVKMERNPKAVRRWIEMLSYNEREHAVRYQPKQRVSRQKKRLNQNEYKIIQCHQQRHVAPEHTARLLQRDISEFFTDRRGQVIKNDMRAVSPGVDLVLAYRFLYYVHGISMVSDQSYDALEKEEIEFGGGASVLEKQIGSDNAADYPPHIRSLALYLAFKYAERKPNVARS